ncbi:putative transporter [uncultured Pleomorphomonas sp.]|uniref:Putative transporter n=1 Tax=uncultured Pleomorphomonas sp. TaxID=442121 RepID=A0A212LGJ2_9HYPH|nr:SLC13 family permease [uncultured Pleomorphomonas sp.]SCM76587.1 putative transporter [uncultured Pleomorphomonas sp.]
MTADLAIVLALLVVAVVLFARGRPPMDAVALMVIVALPLTGIVSVPEALAGFADQSVILIAALFVVGDALVRTGVAGALGALIARAAGGSELRLIVLLMLAVAGLGAFMSSTGVVAIFIPIVLRIARTMRLPPGHLMMPLSMAALISGMMTLVATPPNMVVNAELIRRGHDGFGFFAFTPFGLPVLVLAVAYMLLVRRFLPGSGLAGGPATRPGLKDWVDEYGLAAREARLRIDATSDLLGHRLGELDLRASAGINIIAIERAGRLARRLIRPEASTELVAGDILLIDIVTRTFDLDAFRRTHRLSGLPLSGSYFVDGADEIGMAEAIVPPDSGLAGLTPVTSRFRTARGLTVIGIKRGPMAIEGSLADVVFQPGDTLLLAGDWKAIRRLGNATADLVLLDLPREADDYAPARRHAPFAVAILVAMIAAMASGILANAHAALLACLAMGAFGCTDMKSVYRAISWPTLILIVGMLPFALALERTGGVDLVASAVAGTFGDAQPRIMLAVLFAATALLGLFVSNTATAVLMAPVALAVAADIDASPYPFAMTVALAASTAFMTPVSSPVNTLVVGPGGYRFADFVRLGTPFAVVALLVAVLLVPLLMPF